MGTNGEEKSVLAGDNRGIRPIEADSAGPQARYPERGSIRCIGKTAGKIETDIRAGVSAGDGGTESPQSDLRLAEGPSE